jgi:sporulation protein YlmC with PRC-barrel domain
MMTLKTGVSAVALLLALGLTPALAQTTAPSPPQTPKATEAPKAPVTGQIVTQEDNTILAKDLIGATVYAPDKTKIGSISDLILSKDGKSVQGFLIGVGGFLGIGEKSVAIDMSAFQVVPASTGSTTGAGGAASGSDDPTNVKLKVSWTKEQLKNAPDFQYYKAPAPARTSDRPGGAPTTGMGR